MLAIGIDGAILTGTYGEFGLYKPPRYTISGGDIQLINRNGSDWVELFQWVEELNCWLLIEGEQAELYSVFRYIRNLIVIFTFIVILVFSFNYLQFMYFNNKSEKNNLIYRSSFFDSSDIRFVFSPSGIGVDWSRTSEKVFNINKKKGISISNLGVSKISDGFSKLRATNRTQLFNIKIKGRIYSGSLKTLKKKQNEYILLECKDITRQAEYAKEMKAKEERLRTTMQATNQGYFDLNFENKTEYFDVSLVEMLGYPNNTTVDRSVLDSLVHPDDFNRLVEMNTKIFEVSVNQLLTCEVRMRTKNNEWRYILIKAKAVVRDEKGRAKRIVGVHTDVTLRKNAQIQLELERESVSILNEELKKSAKIKDDFIATMSHELRTPLNSIISLSDLLLDDGYGEVLSENQRNHLEVIERSGQHLLEIINDILDISKVTSGKMELHYEEINFDDVMHAILEMVKTLADKKQVEVSYQNAMNVDRILVDQQRFKQVMINLLTNAIKFTDEHKSVGVNCSNTTSNIKIEVWDEGIGMSQEGIKKLFKPFVQLDSEHTRSQQGTGLGLSLVKNMVELHSGSVSVQSEEGKGSVFTIVLPLKVPQEKLVEHNKPVFI
ncbi:PAS domain-containing sensor histidine kinase [Bermanella sp. WJH001]|uniref:PAS domain-containing sensor histidine kinase n=1 Tax=Bermanella sp. WJH001 TaxID=3048005 RepID=UPI0024BDEF0E|nr:PAS domain-containing sensor histidine kinase [Bermanella sp. WJH001]MDJ1538317.1 PAS domain-containing sensor histidine kinase [Bermanella sp. WJH001]